MKASVGQDQIARLSLDGAGSLVCKIVFNADIQARNETGPMGPISDGLVPAFRLFDSMVMPPELEEGRLCQVGEDEPDGF